MGVADDVLVVAEVGVTDEEIPEMVAIVDSVVDSINFEFDY